MSTVYIKTTPSAVGKLVAAAMARKPAAVRRGLGLAAHRARAILVAATPVDRGEAKRGWRVEQQPPGSKADWAVTNHLPYVAVLERGRRPGTWVSWEGFVAIMDWVKRHGLVSGRTKPGYSRTFYATTFYGREARIAAVADAIIQKIHDNGVPGHYFIRNSQAEIRAAAKAEVKRSLDRSGAEDKAAGGGSGSPSGNGGFFGGGFGR